MPPGQGQAGEEPGGQVAVLLLLLLGQAAAGAVVAAGTELEGAGEEGGEARVHGLLLLSVDAHSKYLSEGGITVYDQETFSLALVGVGLDKVKAVKFTTANSLYGENCYGEGSSHLSEVFDDIDEHSNPGLVRVVVGDGEGQGLSYYSDSREYFICVATKGKGEDGKYASEAFVHQGNYTALLIYMDRDFIPVPVMVLLLVVLLCMSGLFSGLNLGLMSLDQTELKIVQNTGNDKERGYATAIMPIRAMGNFLLCSILLGNVLVNNTLTILLDTLTGGGGTVAIIGSTLCIVVFGEIIPQALCSRHGLAVGANTIVLTKLFMLITAPLSYPISKVLDCVLGTEIGTVYNKQRLMELLKVTQQYNGLEKDEINIVTGALVLKQKFVKDVMTNIDDCYMLPIDAKLDFETISEIKEQGYSRIPVYQGGDRPNVVYILHAKDLLFVDPDDEKPIEEICKFYKNDVNFVYSDTILTDMFDEFKSGEKGHLALVQEVNNDGEADPFYETVGLVTLEDIIEEIIQQEIIDETDVVIDNKTKKKRKRERYKKDAEVKMFQGARHAVTITPHENMAVLQFLTTSVRAFSPENMSEMILRKLLSMDVFRELKIQKDGKENERPEVLMTKGKPCDFFIMIIEGKVEVTIGKEERKFQDGPFSCYGEQMLDQALLNINPSSPLVNNGSRGINLSLSMQSTVSQDVRSAPHLKKTNTQLQLLDKPWIPDYTLKALTDVVYLKVRRNTYMVAIKATRMNSDPATDKDLSDALAKVIENDFDDDLGKTPSVRSPDKGSNSELSEFRRESIRSSLSAMKQKLLGGLVGAGQGERKEDFWDGAGAADLEAAASSASSLNSSGRHDPPSGRGGGPQSLPPPGLATLPPIRRGGELRPPRRNSIARMEGEPAVEVTNGSHTTVILVRGNTEEEQAGLGEVRGPPVEQDVS